MKLYVAMPAREQLYTAFAHNMARLVGYEVARGTTVEIGTNLNRFCHLVVMWSHKHNNRISILFDRT